MHMNFIRAILAFSLFTIGYGGQPVQPIHAAETPSTLPSGMERFEGISDERCPNEWEAYKQAWARAIEEVGFFLSTRIWSETVNWRQQTVLEQVVGKRIMEVEDVKKLFRSTTHIYMGPLTLRGVYKLEQRREQHPDGSWKAGVVLVAPVDQLLADAIKMETELQHELESVQSDAERAMRVLKAQVREKMQQAETASPLLRKLALLEQALQPHEQLQQTEAYIQKARGAQAEGDVVQALSAYSQAPRFTGDAPPNDAPIPDVERAYKQVWNTLREAIARLKSAHRRLLDDERFENLLDEFHQRVGTAKGPFKHALTGESLSLSFLYSSRTCLQAGLRSALIPGWGQFHKEQRFKGLVILGGETVCISIGVLTNLWSHDDYLKASNARYPEDRKFYIWRSNLLSDMGLVAWGIAGVVYITNLIDAIELKGGFLKSEAKDAGTFGFRVHNSAFTASYLKAF